MEVIFNLLAICGLSFLIKESSGPFGIISYLRNLLMRNKYIGVYFYSLLSCYFCIGFHVGYIIYIISTPLSSLSACSFILWALFGGGANLIFFNILKE